MVARLTFRIACRVRGRDSLNQAQADQKSGLPFEADHFEAEVAPVLGISETTVKTHVNHLLVKTGMRDRAQLVAYAFRLGIAR